MIFHTNIQLVSIDHHQHQLSSITCRFKDRIIESFVSKLDIYPAIQAVNSSDNFEIDLKCENGQWLTLLGHFEKTDLDYSSVVLDVAGFPGTKWEVLYRKQ